MFDHRVATLSLPLQNRLRRHSNHRNRIGTFFAVLSSTGNLSSDHNSVRRHAATHRANNWLCRFAHRCDVFRLAQTTKQTCCFSLDRCCGNASNKSLDRSGGSVFRIKPDAAKVPLIRAARSTLTLGVTNLSRVVLITFAICLIVGCAKLSQPAPIATATPTPITPVALSAAEAKVASDSASGLTQALERRWPLAAIRMFCIPERRHNPAYQNLVAESPVWKGVLYSGESTGFDKIAWYANVKKGRVDQYSLGVYRGKDFWLLDGGDEQTLQSPPNYSPDPNEDYFIGHFVGRK